MANSASLTKFRVRCAFRRNHLQRYLKAHCLRRGGDSLRDQVVAVHVTTLQHDESVRLDPSCLGELCLQLGEAGAEDVVCRAIEELAARLAHCHTLWRSGEMLQLRKCARSLIAIAEQVGMRSLARVACDVTDTIDANDLIATGATLTRLMRIGERSLTAVWELQDLSV